jgi:phosphoglycerate dehydrogenase-like enzyme
MASTRLEKGETPLEGLGMFCAIMRAEGRTKGVLGNGQMGSRIADGRQPFGLMRSIQY